MDENKKEYEELLPEQETPAEETSSTEEAALVEDSAGAAEAPAAETESAFSEGIKTDNYDIMPEMQRDPEELARLEGKECVEVEYTFNGDDIREGLKFYQKDSLRRKNIIYTVILLVLFGLYVFNIFRMPGEKYYYFLAVLCLAVIGVVWYLPKQHIKKTAAAVDTQEMRFCMSVYDDCIRVSEQGGGYVLHYQKEVTKVLETPGHFLFCVGKERVFLLPKRCLQDGQEAAIRAFAEAGMGEKYKNIPAKG